LILLLRNLLIILLSNFLALNVPEYEKFEDTKGVIRRRKSKKDRHYNSQKQKGQKDKQNITQKTKN